jgi:osmotically-inducible protein OsmY
MNTKFLFASFVCFLLTSCSFPAFSHAVSATLDKEGVPAGQAVNAPNSDFFVTDQVQQALKNDPDFSDDSPNVKITTKNGVVTLSGTVADENAKVAIGQKVLNVPGVKGIKNNLEANK